MTRARGQVLALLAGEDPSAPIAFAQLQAPQGLATHGVLSADQRGGAPGARPQRTILILPASAGRLVRAALPARTEAQARAAAPFLLEESLASDAASLHYAVGATQTEDGERLLAIIDKALLRRFLERCRLHGADPHIVVFDCAVLQPEAGEAKAVELEGRLVIGAGGQGGLSLEPALARTLAARWLQSLPQPVRRVQYVGAQAGALQAALGPQVVVRSEAPGSAPDLLALEVLARDALTATEAAPNLRQGEFAVGPAAGNSRGRGWRIAAFFAAAAILAQGAAQGVAGFRDQQAAARIQAQTEAAFQALQPEFPAGGDIAAAVRGLQNSRSRAGEHPVLRVAAPLTEVLRETPAARLDLLSHDPQAAGVRLIVSSASPEAVTAVADQLRGRGFTVTQGEGQPSLVRASQSLVVEPAP